MHSLTFRFADRSHRLGTAVLIVLFSIEHIIALVRGEEVVPSWH